VNDPAAEVDVLDAERLQFAAAQAGVACRRRLSDASSAESAMG
jgi:hypothetical protein